MLKKGPIGGLVLLSLLSIGCRGPDLRGRVTDKEGKPVTGANIFVSLVHGNRLSGAPSGLGTQTDSSGAYFFNPGHSDTNLYRINVFTDNFEPASRVVEARTSATVDFVLELAVVHQVTYKVGDQVEAREVEWCPAHIKGVRPEDGGYEIEYDNAPTERALLPPLKIRPRSDGSAESEFPCPFLLKKPKVQ